MAEGGIVPPHSVLAPGTALGLLPSRALSSAQANGMVAQGQRTLESHRDKKEAERTTIRPGCSIRVALQLEIPPGWANSNVSLDAAAPPEMVAATSHDAVNGVALTGRNSH